MCCLSQEVFRYVRWDRLGSSSHVWIRLVILICVRLVGNISGLLRCVQLGCVGFV